MTKRTPAYSPEVRERAVRMVFEHRDEYSSQYEAIRSIAAKIGCSGETLRHWVRQAERDQGLRAGQPLHHVHVRAGLALPQRGAGQHPRVVLPAG